MENKKKNYIPLEDLEVYKLSRELSKIGWKVYNSLSWQDKKIMGDQFIESTDSVGANIAESYGRFHYMDKIKFLYNARGSLIETSDHWIEILQERNKIKNEKLYKDYKIIAEKVSLKLQNYISSLYRSKNNKSQ